MFIIFDLDDTLIDTSGYITPFALESALEAMAAAGLVISGFTEALIQLKRINEAAASSIEAITEFVEIHGGNASHIEIGKQQLHADIPEDLPIFPVEGAVELIVELAQHHQLALVTIGKLSRQMGKLKKAGVDSAFFSSIIASEEKNKKSPYQWLLESYRYNPQETVVCGDRIAVDLAPGKELGFKTVHLKRGRGLNYTGQKEDVDFQITALKDMKNIISHLMIF